MRLASWMSFGMIVTLLAWIAHKFASSNKRTKKASVASWTARIALPCHRNGPFENMSDVSFTKRAKGNFRISKSVLFWYLLISMRHRVPGRNLCLRAGVMMPMGGRAGPAFAGVFTPVVRADFWLVEDEEEEEEVFWLPEDLWAAEEDEEEEEGVGLDFLAGRVGDLEREREREGEEEGEEEEEEVLDFEPARVGERPRVVLVLLFLLLLLLLLLLLVVILCFGGLLGDERVGVSGGRACLEE
jgi:hypothetical protein